MRRISALAFVIAAAVFAVPNTAAACLACSGDPNFPDTRFCGYHGAVFNFSTCPDGPGSAFLGECDQCEVQTTSVPFEA